MGRGKLDRNKLDRNIGREIGEAGGGGKFWKVRNLRDWRERKRFALDRGDGDDRRNWWRRKRRQRGELSEFAQNSFIAFRVRGWVLREGYCGSVL